MLIECIRMPEVLRLQYKEVVNKMKNVKIKVTLSWRYGTGVMVQL